MAASRHTYIHTTSANSVTLVWGSLRLAPIIMHKLYTVCIYIMHVYIYMSVCTCMYVQYVKPHFTSTEGFARPTQKLSWQHFQTVSNQFWIITQTNTQLNWNYHFKPSETNLVRMNNPHEPRLLNVSQHNHTIHVVHDQEQGGDISWERG